MKKVYIAGKFNLKKDKNLSLEEKLVDDFRSLLLGNPYLLTYKQKNLKLNDTCVYTGPFYCEMASNGDYTSIDCNVVLENEYEAVLDSDMYIAVFGEHFSVGTIVELGWALNNNKDIIILYQEEDSHYSIKSEYWFAIAYALKVKESIKVYKYKHSTEIHNILKEVLI